MIIKIQISQFTNGNESILIYSGKKRKNLYQSDDPDEVSIIKSLLKGRPKAYFDAKIINTKYQIYNEVPAQDW